MTQVTDAKNNENDDLICPITLELFRDPVIAEDGRVYERKAITKWILEHGTSPFTRQKLQINNLQPDDHLRCLADRRRSSTVSYNAQNDVVTLSPLRLMSRDARQILAQQRPDQIRIHSPTRKYHPQMIYCIIFSFLIGISITLGTVLGISHSNSYSNSTESQIPWNYSSILTSNYTGSITTNYSLTHQWWGTGRHYYQAIQVIVSINGSYQFRSFSRIDMYGCLYSPYFDATNPNISRLIYNDDSGGDYQFYLKISLRPGNYILIATTYNANVIGTFSIVVSGPATVILRR